MMMSKWILVIMLALQVHFAASYHRLFNQITSNWSTAANMGNAPVFHPQHRDQDWAGDPSHISAGP